MSFFGKLIPSWVPLAVIACLVALLGVQELRVNHAQNRLYKEQKARSDDSAKRSDAALKDSEKTAEKESTHAASTQTASDTFTQAAPVRDAALRAELADALRMRNDATARAARYRAQSEGDAAARRRLADRAEALDRSLAEGREVVADLRGALGRRDDEVILLLGVIDADRALLDQTPDYRLGSWPKR